jgi:hypothetical protein
MHLTFSPQVGQPGQPTTTLHVGGDVLSINGTPYDLSPVPEGGDGEWADSPILGPIRRIDGLLHVTVRVALGPDAAHHQPTDPAHWIMPDADGDVTIAYVRIPQTEPEGDA